MDLKLHAQLIKNSQYHVKILLRGLYGRDLDLSIINHFLYLPYCKLTVLVSLY